ncbi:hypothetical protein [Anaeromyxobacter dehalogenans]|uniref:hypothetical protein n=1 Tax=Anaeromyxobacter dehalogenans TaxID=161493 RepID=UPI0002E1C4C1|nr:hypothetical protein [Anaeromyxobacter dehalogenans]
MGRAKTTVLVLGICAVVTGAMMLPFPVTNPKVFTQSFFALVASTGAFARPGFVVILGGLGCLAVAALLPSDRW